MILWNILLSVFLALSLTVNVFVFLKGILNTKAIIEVLGPEVDKIKNEVIKIKKSL